MNPSPGKCRVACCTQLWRIHGILQLTAQQCSNLEGFNDASKHCDGFEIANAKRNVNKHSWNTASASSSGKV